MNWTNPSKPKEDVSSYDHVISETPIGRLIIEWKSWKTNPSYDVMLDDKWLGVEFDLDEAKLFAENHLNDILNKLKVFLE